MQGKYNGVRGPDFQLLAESNGAGMLTRSRARKKRSCSEPVRRAAVSPCLFERQKRTCFMSCLRLFLQPVIICFNTAHNTCLHSTLLQPRFALFSDCSSN